MDYSIHPFKVKDCRLYITVIDLEEIHVSILYLSLYHFRCSVTCAGSGHILTVPHLKKTVKQIIMWTVLPVNCLYKCLFECAYNKSLSDTVSFILYVSYTFWWSVLLHQYVLKLYFIKVEYSNEDIGAIEFATMNYWIIVLLR